MAHYSTHEELRVFMVTWNVGAIEDIKDIQDILRVEADIVIVGLQEMMTLNTKNIVYSNTNHNEEQWNSIILMNLQLKGQYTRIHTLSLVGLFLGVYCRSEMVSRVSQMECDTVKTGFSGTLGNKGGVAIRFLMDDSQFCIINCHLEAGAKNVQERLQGFQEINYRAF